MVSNDCVQAPSEVLSKVCSRVSYLLRATVSKRDTYRRLLHTEACDDTRVEYRVERLLTEY